MAVLPDPRQPSTEGGSCFRLIKTCKELHRFRGIHTHARVCTHTHRGSSHLLIQCSNVCGDCGWEAPNLAAQNTIQTSTQVQQPSYLSHHHCLSGSRLTGSQSQDPEFGTEFRHYNMGGGHANWQVKCHLLEQFSNFLLVLSSHMIQMAGLKKKKLVCKPIASLALPTSYFSESKRS